MANYLIAVGGTGQHVALAVADLMALAHEIYMAPDNFPAVHLILVDADQAANTDRPSAWQEARNRLNELGLLGGDSFECIPLPVNSHLSDTRRMYEFVNRIGASFGPNAADALLLEEQREVDVTTGFYAQPRVGAMMAEWLFGEVSRGEAVNPELARIFRLAGDPANRIVIAGSGVGGTGAGFAPALVRQLSATIGGRLMALMATEWFRLGGTCSNRLSEAVQKTNANSALWHAAQPGSRSVRTVLFGHPHVSRAPEEECQSGAFQARKNNLTVPYYAAAAAMSFFAGDSTDGTHVPAATVVGGVVSLAPALKITPGVTLSELVAANVEAVGRLALASEYLRQRYRGFVLPFSSLSGRVAALDGTDRQLMEGPLIAKLAALRNLGVSDEKLPVRPHHHRGLATLRGWAGDKVDRPYDLWKSSPVIPPRTSSTQAASVVADGETAALLIRKIGFAGRVSGGSVVPVTAAQVRELVGLDDVDVSKVPASDAVSLTLGEIFRTWDARSAEEKKDITTLLVSDGRVTRPVLVCGDKGDRPREWLKRWLLLVNLLVEGKLTVEQKPLPFTSGKVLSFRGVPVGELSRGYVCVPLVNGHWNDESTTSGLWNAASRLETLATWCRTVTAAALCKTATLPSWLEILIQATAPHATNVRQYTTSSVAVQWTDNSTVSLPLPNAAATDDDAIDCVVAICLAFGVLQDPPALTSMSAPVRGIVQEIEKKALRIPSLSGSEEKSIVFAELLSPAARDCLLGEVIVDVTAQRAWRLASTHRIVTSAAGELLTENAGCFRSDGRAKWLTPLRREYIPLLTTDALDVRVEERGSELRATITIHDRTFIESYGASRQRAINPILLQWPTAVAHAATNMTVLFDVQDHRFAPQTMQLLTHDPGRKSWKLSQPLTQRHSLHYIASDGNVPYALSFELEHSDVGFMKVERTIQQLQEGEQRIAVDFGTSATVVAIEGIGKREILDLLATGSDATSEVWKGHELAPFQWYGTRSVDARIREKRRAPSALVFLGPAKEARPQKPKYGDHVLLDQDDWAWENGDTSLMFDIKWTREPAYRETYLIHHLEQCIAAGLSKGLLHSRRLNVTFTMPLRQRARAGDFVEEVQGVAAVLQRRTGFTIMPRFAYESQVIAPDGPPRADVDATLIADLGGGTLDLFARHFGDGRREGTNQDVFESARLGGHSLVEWLTRDLDGAQLAEYRRNLRIGAGAALDEESALVAGNYFDVIKRFSALWMDSVWRYWTGGSHPGRIDVQLLGKGWSLPSSPADEMALHLSDIARSVGSQLTFRKSIDPTLRADPKELLAHRALLYHCGTTEEFKNFEPASVNGIEVQIAGEVRRDDDVMRGLGAAIPTVSITPAGLNRVAQLTAASEEVVAVVRDRMRVSLTTRSTGVDEQDGALLPGRNTWVASPLAVAAEIYTRQVLLQVNR
jgi:hypothetical protein